MDNGSLTSSLLALVVMVAAMAALPWLLKRGQQRQQAVRGGAGVSAQVLSSIIVGPNQRVVTVEVGQGASKTCLVLGVSPQSIHCLHVLGQPGAATAPMVPPVSPSSFAGALDEVQSAGALPKV